MVAGTLPPPTNLLSKAMNNGKGIFAANAARLYAVKQKDQLGDSVLVQVIYLLPPDSITASETLPFPPEGVDLVLNAGESGCCPIDPHLAPTNPIPIERLVNANLSVCH